MKRNLPFQWLYPAMTGLPLALMALVVSGCGPYRLQGLVVEAPSPGMILVNADDERLQWPGLEDATVQLTLDPGRPTEEKKAATLTDRTGAFTLEVHAIGAGFLEYEAMIVVRKPGYRSTWQRMPLPSSSKRLLVMLTPGRDDYRPPVDPVEESLKYKDIFER